MEQRVKAGMKHGHLTVLQEVERDAYSIRRYKCLCECGRVVVLRSNHFTPSRRFCSHQCALLSEQRTLPLIGKQFGRWTVIAKSPRVDRKAWWECICDCGTRRTVAGTVLSFGSSKSCGCLIRDMRKTGRTLEEEILVRRERVRLAHRRNPARVKAAKIKYETKRDKATPVWLSDDDWQSMNAFYELARTLSQDTGIPHQVDHIIPINGELVSGLHVPLNLQVLTRSENVAKSNRYAELSGD